MEDKPLSVILISFYCFFKSLAFLLVGFHNLLANRINNMQDLLSSVPVIACVVFAMVLVAVGVGILEMRQWGYKALFFILVIFISSFASLVFVSLLGLMMSVAAVFAIFQGLNVSSAAWFYILAFFLSQMIVLRYITRREVVMHFGPIGDLLRPF